MNKRLLGAIILLSTFAFGYFVGTNKISFDWKHYNVPITVVNQAPPSNLGVADFSMFWIVWDKIKNNYYDKKVIDPQKLVNGAISGMVQSLGDPYTVYLPPTQNTDFKQSMAGQFSGIGAELGMKDKQIIVMAPLDGMPAQKAGLKPGDAILKIDTQSTAGWTLAQAVDKIRGPRGTSVILTILHKDQEKSQDVTIVRDTISVKSVDGWTKKVKDIPQVSLKGHDEDQITYIRLSQFGDNTNQEWVALVNKLVLQIQQNKSRGVILDLRNNPGGYLTDAVFIASEFIKEGVIVSEEKGTGEKEVLSVNRRGLLTDIPVVVLINKGSASASEIVAGALRDRRNIKLIGDISFGKGTVQQAEDLGGGAGLHVTIAKWLTPNGAWVHGKGLTPDISISLDEKDPTHDQQLEKAIQDLVQ